MPLDLFTYLFPSYLAPFHYSSFSLLVPPLYWKTISAKTPWNVSPQLVSCSILFVLSKTLIIIFPLVVFIEKRSNLVILTPKLRTDSLPLSASFCECHINCLLVLFAQTLQNETNKSPLSTLTRNYLDGAPIFPTGFFQGTPRSYFSRIYIENSSNYGFKLENFPNPEFFTRLLQL